MAFNESLQLNIYDPRMLPPDRKHIFRSSAVSDRDARRTACEIHSNIYCFNLHSFSTYNFHYGVRNRAVHILEGIRNLHLHFQL